jgi:hypothetical protein
MITNINSFNVEVNNVASLSTKYLTKEKNRGVNGSGETKSRLNALMYSVNSELLPILMATKHKMDRLPIVYLSEANA